MCSPTMKPWQLYLSHKDNKAPLVLWAALDHKAQLDHKVPQDHKAPLATQGHRDLRVPLD
jgi:hypothetical protein